MAYVVAEPCIDVLDRSCVLACPVDCIYEGRRSVYVHPDECIDCGACVPVCPVDAIYPEDELPAGWSAFAPDQARFFTEPLPGRSAPLESPGGADRVGRVGADTAVVAAYDPPSTARRRARADPPVAGHRRSPVAAPADGAQT